MYKNILMNLINPLMKFPSDIILNVGLKLEKSNNEVEVVIAKMVIKISNLVAFAEDIFSDLE